MDKITTQDLDTWGDAYEAISRRIVELYGEIERDKNIIFVNRNHITAAKRRIRVLEKGIKLIEKGHKGKAIKLFDLENEKQFHG